jgi:hypothetical protein
VQKSPVRSISAESTVVSTASWGDTNVVHYKIQTDGMIYVLEYAFNPAAAYRFESNSSNVPHVISLSSSVALRTSLDPKMLQDFENKHHEFNAQPYGDKDLD